MLLIQYLTAQPNVSDEVLGFMSIIKQELDKVFMAIEEGKASQKMASAFLLP
jgi:hypothetical protein